jgi:hypothetical protein
MLEVSPSVQLITLFCAGCALFAIGIIQTLFPQLGLVKKNVSCLLLLVAAVGVAMSIAPAAGWYVFGISSLGWGLAVVLGSEVFRVAIGRGFGWVSDHPWAPLSVAGLGVGLGSVYYQECRDLKQVESDASYANAILYKPPMTSETEEAALTDEGRRINLMKAVEERSHEETAYWERHFLEGGEWQEHVIARVPPNDHSNCHGWVFTGGRYWLSPQDAAIILKDNHYQAVTNPEPGDLAIYHDDAGNVLHSGIVRGKIDEDILIESKWGTLGVYLHLAQGCVYGSTVAYYHSGRQGHLLRGITPATSAANARFIKKD